MEYAVITGVSRGLGESVAKLFLESGVNVIGISRTINKELPVLANEYNKEYKHYTCDLGDTNALEETFQQISDEIFSQDIMTLYLVNNAAVIEPVNQAMHIKSKDLVQHVQVNTIAPMVLTNLFLKRSNENAIPFIGAIVTSGAAERPVYGWSSYCSSKAGMNMYTTTVALEQEELNTGNKVIAFNPGIMDTEMQAEIRTKTKEKFSEIETFKNYKENNVLKDADSVGGVLVDILKDEDVVNGKIYNVKTYF